MILINVSELRSPYESVFHIILHCEFTNKLWNDIDPVLKELHPNLVNDEEKTFGIVEKKKTPGILLRNWLTYILRECISKEERIAYHSAKTPNLQNIKRKFNNAVELDIHAFFYIRNSGLRFVPKVS